MTSLHVIFGLALPAIQTRRSGRAYRGRAPPNENCAPPSEDRAPKKLTGSGQLDWKSRTKLVFFVDWQRISWRFWDEDLFSENTCFRPEKLLKFAISGGKFLAISVKSFFVGDHLFSAEKTAWFCDLGRKIPSNFSEDLFFFFWRSPASGRKNRLNLRFRLENPFESLLLTLFTWSRMG